MFFLSILSLAEQRDHVLHMALAVFILCVAWFQVHMNSVKLSQACLDLGYRCMPDTSMGFPFDLNQLYDIWNAETHRAYATGSLVDFCLIMPSYTLITGILLIRAAKRLNMTDRVAYLALFTVVADIGETYISRHGSLIYPKERVSEFSVRLASLCSQAKYFSLYAATAIVLVSYSRRIREHNVKAHQP